MTSEPLLESNCAELELVARGKVRDIYRVDANHLLLVATDRLSAYDAVMQNGIPHKGEILTRLSVFWFRYFHQQVPSLRSHLVADKLADMPDAVQQYAYQLDGRSLLIRRVRILPIEVIVRGYLSGSGWKEYKRCGTVHGIALPAGLVESDRLPQPLFTPSTKAAVGERDENIHPDKAAELIGNELCQKVAEIAVQLYTLARDYALTKGIIIADTKFEFGLDDDGNLVLADEVLTPDSSRFWPAATYKPGKAQDSFDKQFVRDYLSSAGVDGKRGVTLPADVVAKTLEKYQSLLDTFIGN